MKKLLIVALVLLVAGCAAPADADPVPEYSFDSETCILTIAPDTPNLDSWSVVVNTETMEIGLHLDSEGPWVAPFVVINAAGTVDLSAWVDCGIATPNEEIAWSTLKSLYR